VQRKTFRTQNVARKLRHSLLVFPFGLDSLLTLAKLPRPGGKCATDFASTANNRAILFLGLGLSRILIGLAKGCVDHSGKCEKVVLKFGNVPGQRRIHVQHISSIAQ